MPKGLNWQKLLKRDPTDEEFVMYLNHPADAIKTIEFQKKFGNPNSFAAGCVV